jgi:hypothetical protein
MPDSIGLPPTVGEFPDKSLGKLPSRRTDLSGGHGMVDSNGKSRTETTSECPAPGGDDKTAEPGARSVEKKSEHHRRSERQPVKGRRRLSHLFWDFRYELLALLFIGGGVFLLVAPFKISTWLYGLVIQALSFARNIAVWLIGSVGAIEKSDIGGVVLLVCAAGLIGFDIRARILRRHGQLESEPLCSCGNQMRRVRTSLFQQALGSLFRVRIKRFFCSKCGRRIALWQDLHESDW